MIGDLSGYWGKSDCETSDPLSIISEEELKWYDYDDHMKAVSERYPDYWFLLEGEGDNREDIWKALYHNGSSEIAHAEIIYPDFMIL